MKIILTGKEKEAMGRIFSAMGVVPMQLLREIDSNVLASAGIDMQSGDLTVEFDSEYMTEYLEAASETMSVAFPLGKTVVNMVKGFMSKADDIVNKHIERKRAETEAKLKKEKEQKKNQPKCCCGDIHVNDDRGAIVAVITHCPGLTGYGDLPRPLQIHMETLYGKDAARELFEKLLMENRKDK